MLSVDTVTLSVALTDSDISEAHRLLDRIMNTVRTTMTVVFVTLLDWMWSFLIDSDQLSAVQWVLLGVPQGSILYLL